MNSITDHCNLQKPFCVPSNQSLDAFASAVDGKNQLEPFRFANKASYEHSWDLVHHYLIENSMLNAGNEWILKNAPQLPLLGDEQRTRLNSIIHTYYDMVFFLPSDQVIKKKINLKTCLEILGHNNIKIIGGGVQWILGKAYFHQFLSDLKVPEELLTEELYQELQDFPPDVDFRIEIDDSSCESMQTWINDLFIRLGVLFGLPSQQISESCEKVYASRLGDKIQLSMATLTFYEHTPIEKDSCVLKKKFNVDLVFVKSLPRKSLCDRDALSLSLEMPYKGLFALGSDLPEIRNALVHSITRLLSVHDPHTVDRKGLPLLLSATVKGRFPSKIEQLEYLYNRAINNFPISALGQDLVRAIKSHNRGSDEALLAALINVLNFLGPEAKRVFSSSMPCRGNENYSFLGKIDQLIEEGRDSVSCVQTLILLHAYLGFGDGIRILRKTKSQFIELKSRELSSSNYNSIFIREKIGDADIDALISTVPSDSLNEIFSDWLLSSRLDGPPMPDHYQPLIGRLFDSDRLIAQKVSFFLLLRLHLQRPTDENVETMLVRFSMLILKISTQERLHYSEMLFSTINKSGIYDPEKASIFEVEIKKYYKNPEIGLLPLAHALYKLRSFRFSCLAVKLLLNPNSSFTDKSSAHLVLDPSSQHTLPLFFQYHTMLPLEVACKFDFLLELLKSASKPEESINEIYAYIKTVSPMLKKDFDISKLQEATAILENIDSGLVYAFRKALRGNSVNVEEQKLFWNSQKLKKIKSAITSGNELRNCKAEFFQFLQSDVYGAHLKEFQDIFKLLFEKLISNGSNDFELALNLLEDTNVLVLFEDVPDALLGFFYSLSELVGNPVGSLKGRMCLALGKLLVASNISENAYIAGVERFRVFLEALAAMPSKKTKIYKNELKNLLSRVIVRFPSSGNTLFLYHLLKLADLLDLQLKFDCHIAACLLDDIKEKCTGADADLLICMEHACNVLKNNVVSLSNQGGEALATAFLGAFVRLRMASKGIFWAKQLKNPDPLIDSLAQLLTENCQWKDLQQLVEHLNGGLFNPRDLCKRVLELVEAFKGSDLLKIAELYLSNFRAIQNNCSQELLVSNIKTLVGQLVSLNKEAVMVPALNLLSYYNIPVDDLWKDVIRLLPKRVDFEPLFLAWSVLKFHPETFLADSIKMLFMVYFQIDGMIDISLVKYISRDMSEDFLNCFKNAYERMNVCGKLLKLCLENRVSIESKKLTFEALDVFRAEHIPEIDQAWLIEAWLDQASFYDTVDCFTYLEKFGFFKRTIPAVPSDAVFSAIEMMLKSDQLQINERLLRNVLMILSQEDFQNCVEKARFTELFVMLLPKVLVIAKEKQCRPMVAALISCYFAHRKHLFSVLSEDGKFCFNEIMKSVDLLLLPPTNECAFSEKQLNDIFADFVGLKRKNMLDFKNKKSVTQILIDDAFYSFDLAINCLLKSTISHMSGLSIMLTFCQKAFNFILENSSLLSMLQRAKLSVMLDDFVFSNLFYLENEPESSKCLENRHSSICLSIVSKGKNSGFVVLCPDPFIRCSVFWKNCEGLGIESKSLDGKRVVEVIEILLLKQTPRLLQKAVNLMCDYPKHLRVLPDDLHNILKRIFAQLDKVSLKSEVLQGVAKQLLLFFSQIFSKNNYKETEEIYFEQWGDKGLQLFVRYKQLLQSLFQLNQEDQKYLCSYAAVSIITMKTLVRTEENTGYFVEVFMGFLSFASILLTKYPDDDGLRSQVLKIVKSPPLPITLRLSVLYLEKQLTFPKILGDRVNGLVLAEGIVELHKKGFFDNRNLFDHYEYVYRIVKNITNESDAIIPPLTRDLIMDELKLYRDLLNELEVCAELV